MRVHLLQEAWHDDELTTTTAPLGMTEGLVVADPVVANGSDREINSTQRKSKQNKTPSYSIGQTKNKQTNKKKKKHSEGQTQRVYLR
jgi:hypothetical protein